MTARAIRFYFDYESPNAYLAWSQLPALAARHQAEVEPVPVLYAALLDAHGQLGPGEQPAKARWMMKNVFRKAALLGLELRAPAYLPFNPLLALRVTLLAPDEKRHAVIDALFRAVWARALHVSEPAVVEAVLADLGLDGAALVATAQEAEVKERLRNQTAGAVARGVFGVPTMEAAGELFWGYDDLPFLELLLAGRDPLPSDWRGDRLPAPQASSHRRRFR
ncbi:MAG TPA: 2-hydroxychromene-2-carboxylate isomerase [Kofleriaceae bacterium]|nr:2-hydroxychromene-2-carboxylate isomerase [Kofleriaceae bacterium]